MSRISYFQRFSQRENHATNNTLLLLRYFSEEAPTKLQQVLTSWIDAPIEIGLRFEQQIRGKGSVPDGLIKQSALEVYLETKHGNGIWLDQIVRHAAGISAKIAGEKTLLLIGLTRENLSDAENQKLKNAVKPYGLTYRGLTFTSILDDLRAVCASHEDAMLRILEDYQGYLESENLLDSRQSKMVAFLCGVTYAENIRYSLYYEPASRNCKMGMAYVGAYKNKIISAIGKVLAIAVFRFENKLIKSVALEYGNVSESQRENLLECVNETDYYNLGQEDLRVYFLDKYIPTNFQKTSPSGMMGHRYFDLSEILDTNLLDANTETAEVAKLLNGKTFQ